MIMTPSSQHQVEKRVHSLITSVYGPTVSKDAVTADAFAWAWASDNYLKKFEGVADERMLTVKCKTTFKDVERKNRLTNGRLRKLALSGAALFCLEEARRKIASLLGPFDLEEFSRSCEWGPGATATLVAADATLDQKILEHALSVSRLALPYGRLYLEWDRHWMAARIGVMPDGPYSVLANNFTIVDEERYTTVSKDSRSRRGISIQPTLNLFLQKGIGAMVRSRLKRVGVDLDDQSRNQWLASVSQRMGLSTLDLANASDTLCYELVRLLVPEEWFAHLNKLRCHSIGMDGLNVHLEKFSAMGNGFTFELESLIFWGLITSVEKRFDLTGVHGIYGDDLIVDTVIAKAVISLLAEVGFTTNDEKSFTEGRFYESCGAHYFDGVDVTPPYQKEPVVDLVSAIRAANRLFRWALRLGGGVYYDARVFPMWSEYCRLAFSFMDELNARRWVRWIENGCKGREPNALPFPFIPHWLEDDFGLCWPEPFFVDRGVIRFDRLSFVPYSIDTDGWSIYSCSMRRSSERLVDEGGFSSLASYGFVNPRGRNKTVATRGKTAPNHHACWPCDWPLETLG